MSILASASSYNRWAKPRTSLADDGIEEAERLTVLDGDEVVADDAEDHLGVVADDGFSLWHIKAVPRGQWGKLNVVIEAGGNDSLFGGGGPVELGAETM